VNRKLPRSIESPRGQVSVARHITFLGKVSLLWPLMSPIEKKIRTKPATSISAYLAEFDVLHSSLVAKEKMCCNFILC
jgi:hypothetical protein